MLGHQALCGTACLPPPSEGEVTTRCSFTTKAGGGQKEEALHSSTHAEGCVVPHSLFGRVRALRTPAGPTSITSELQASPHTAQQSNLGLDRHEKHHWLLLLLDSRTAFKRRPLPLLLAKAPSMHIAGLGLNPLTSSCHNPWLEKLMGIRGMFSGVAKGNAPPI